MGVRILKREYANPYAPITETKPDWLIGNVGDWTRLKMQVEAGVDFLASQQDPIYINKEERSIKIMNGKKWSDYGFDTGATIKFTYKVDTVEGETTTTESFGIDLILEQLFADTLIYTSNDDMDDVPFDSLPTDRGNMRVYSVKLFDTRDIQGIRMKYANIENKEVENHTLKSFIDGTETELICSGLQDLTEGSGWKEMETIGYQSGMSINGARIRKTQTTGNLQVNYNIPKNDFIRLVILNNNANVKQSIAINKISGSVSPIYKNSVRQTYSSTAQQSQMFLFNSDVSEDRLLHIKTGTVIINNDGGGNNRVLRLVLRKWKDGASLNFDSEIILDTYEITNGIRGFNLVYDNYINVELQLGDSLSLDYSWEISNPNPFRSPALDFKTNTGEIIISNAVGDTSYKKKYEIEIDFMLSSFFEENTDLENNTPPDVMFDANALTDSIKLLFLPEWNNPNISITNDMKETERLGNTGWFNENYNGLKNNFKIESVNYKDLGGASITSLSFGSETKVIIQVSGVKNLSIESDFKYGFIWLPSTEEQYKDKITPFHKNTKINSSFNVVSFNPNNQYPFIYEGYSEDQAKMNVRNVSFAITGDILTFEAIFSPTPEFRDFFIDRLQDRKYAIWLSVADRTLETNFSDRVSLLADVKNMDYFIPISGELPNVTNSFIEHPEDYLVAGVDIYNGFLEDDILARAFFTLDKDKKLDQVILGYEVENILNGLSFELDKFVANTRQYNSLPDGSQQIEYNNERGYKLAPNNSKNWVKIIRDPASDGNNKFGYQILFAQKIRWEDWIAKANVPTEFFNSSLKLNGYNNNWLGYLNGSHKINFFILFDMIEGNGILRYKNKFEIRFDGYDENTGIITTHEYFNNETNATLNIGNDVETGRPLAVLLANKNTRIEISYQKEEGNWDLSNVYAIIGIEIYEGAGVMDFRQLSSIWGSENDNILIPLAGEQKLKVELMQPNIIKTTCLVDFTRLSPAAKYKITGRIGCFKNNNGIPEETRIYESNYESKYE